MSGKGKGKAAAGGKGKGKEPAEKGGKGGELKTCNHVKGRHILCEKQGKIQEAWKKLSEGWLDDGNNVPASEFGKLAQEYSECSSGKKGGDLGWFPRGKMVGEFQNVAFATPEGKCSNMFKTANGWHIFYCEGRKA